MGNQISLEQRIKGAVLGSFVGDALTLGVHWIYDPKKIAAAHGRVGEYIDPAGNQYHKAKKLGDFTHYGDQAMELLRSVDGELFGLDSFKGRWTKMWTPDYPGYVDGATKATLESGKSDSNDLAGASRIGPLVAVYAGRDKETEFVEAAKAQTAYTHGDPAVIESASFFASLTHRILHGVGLEEGLDSLAAQSWQHIDPANALKDARDEIENDTVEALVDRGLDCHMPSAFPATLFVLLKHQDSLVNALIENTMAGGDSAARGMLIGVVMGALHGVGAIPEHLISGLNVGEEIQSWLNQFVISEEHLG